jgi:radical SAM-linked protein
MMRVAERSALRAQLPLQHTQGFNPHPILSLPCPRPVGVASQDDLLVLTLRPEADNAWPTALGERLNAAAPRGLEFRRAHEIDRKAPLAPLSVTYRLEVDKATGPDLAEKARRLKARDRWSVRRRTKAKGRKARGQVKQVEVDIRPMVASLEVTDESLTFRLVAGEGRWAKCQEVLDLLGLDTRLDLARLVRTEARFAFEA